MVNHKGLLELLLDETQRFVGLYDPLPGCFIQVNKWGLALFEAEDLNHFNRDLRQEWLPEQRLAAMLPVLGQRKKWQEETILPTKNGREFWGRLEVDLLEQAPGQYLWVVRIANIDQYKNAEREAQGKEEKFRAVFEYAAIGILMVDERGQIVMANRFIESLFGFKPEELTGQQVEVLLPESLREAHVRLREGYVGHPKIRPMGEGLALQGQRKDGAQFPVEVILSYFYEEQKMLAVAFIQDISFKVQATQQLLDQKAAFQQLNANLETEVFSRTQALVETLQHLEKSKNDLEKALAKEKELSELKSRFVAMASHEFRTPLSVIQSSSDLIRKYVSAEGQANREKHIRHIQSSVGYLTDILEEFLSVGKLEEGRVKANFADLNWLDLMEEVMTDLQGSLKPGQQFDFRHTGESIVRLDKSLIRKVLINLLSNAIKFSPPQTTIMVTSQSREEGFAIAVQDQGMGISESDLKHLCERFYRGANALNTQGTGLGLHIVYKYVELLHGKMDIQSQLGQGTTVQLLFYPMTDAQLQTAGANQQQHLA
jgi:PAS domain S-box-containing protein